MSETRPAPASPEPVLLDLEWLGDHRLRGRSGDVEMVMDSPPVAERAPTDPKRIVKVALHYTLAGAIPPDRVERAIELSRERYGSVWHSMRPDIEFTTSVEVVPSL
jgi:uncharacterized OsmC-like protein